MDQELEAQIARRRQVLDQVNKILVERLHLQLDADAIEPDAALFGTGLGLDSVDALELVVSTETTFGIRLPQTALRSSLRTINSLVDLIVEYSAMEQSA